MLSVRMQAVADMVSPGSRLADIGTDHGFVPIELVKSGRCPSAIAADVRSGPLSHAAANIEEAGLTEQIETRLSDGLDKIRPGEADSVIIAGMGGMLMMRILEDSLEMIRTLRELILQPQSDITEVRRWLHTHDMRIIREQIVYDMGKYYFVMKTVAGVDATYDEADDRYGRMLLQSGSNVLSEYLEHEKEKYRSIREQLSIQKDSDKSRGRLVEIDHLLEINDQAAGRNHLALSRKEDVS